MSNTRVLSLALILGMTIALLAPLMTCQTGYENVDSDYLKAKLDSSDDFFLLDFRTMEEYLEGHIDNANLITLNTDGTLDPEHIGDLPADKATIIVVYCKSGSRSSVGSGILVDMGYSGVKNMEQGILSWPSTYGLETGGPPNYATSNPSTTGGDIDPVGLVIVGIVVVVIIIAVIQVNKSMSQKKMDELRRKRRRK